MLGTFFFSIENSEMEEKVVVSFHMSVMTVRALMILLSRLQHRTNQFYQQKNSQMARSHGC